MMLVNANPTYISAAQAEENTCQEKEKPGADRLQHYVNVPEARRFPRAALKITPGLSPQVSRNAQTHVASITHRFL